MNDIAMAFSIPELLYEEGSFGVFVLVTLVLGGAAGWLTGRAIALTWRQAWQIVLYTLILGGAIRFIHFSVFGGTLLTPYYYAVDTAICMGFSFLGFRLTRVGQMVTQYGWINEAEGLLRWRRKTP
jgi:hypothetical protein